MTNYTYLGWGTTDSNGVAHLDHDANGDPVNHSYTGSGAGELDIVASLDDPNSISDSSLQSEPYSICDAIKYDKGLSGTGNHNDIWSTNTSSGGILVERTSEYTEFKEAVSGTNISNTVNGVTGSCIIEFDYCQVDGSVTTTFMQLKDSSSQVYIGGINLTNFGSSDVSLGNWYHLKVIISNGTFTLKNETKGTTASARNLTNTPTQFAFWTASDITTIRFKEFEIYPI